MCLLSAGLSVGGCEGVSADMCVGISAVYAAVSAYGSGVVSMGGSAVLYYCVYVDVSSGLYACVSVTYL